MLDISVSYDRYKFFGYEFLTWLWCIVETQPEVLLKIDGSIQSLEIGNRIMLENRKDELIETITIKGDDAGLEEGKLALKKGAIVSEINLVFKAEDQEWQMMVKGESLNLTNLKTPVTAAIENKEDIEGAVLEKIYLFERILHFFEKLYKFFIELRISDNWSAEAVPGIKNWILS